MQKEGENWKLHDLENEVQVIAIEVLDNDNVYAIGTLNLRYFFYRFKQGQWAAIDSVDMLAPTQNWHFGNLIWGDPQIGIFSVGDNGVFKYTDANWHKLLGGHPFRAVYGSSHNNMFAAALFNNVFHYNGNSWKRDPFFDEYYFDAIGNIWCNNDYVFFAARENGRFTYIFRGVRQ